MRYKKTFTYIGLMMSIIVSFNNCITVSATTIDRIQGEIDSINNDINSIKDQKQDAQRAKDDAQGQLNGVNGQIGSISGAMGDLDAEIEGVNQELVGLLTAIEMIETDIADKEDQIAKTQVEYEEALATENEQYEAMKIRIKYMYEKGDATYIAVFLEAQNSFADALNKVDYVNQLYTYDRLMLEKYKAAVEHTKEVWDRLEEEKSELETSKTELQEEQAELEKLEEQLQAEYDNYNVMLAQAKQQAAVYKAKINQQTNELRKLEAEQKAKENEIKQKEQEKKAEQDRLKEEEERLKINSENTDSGAAESTDTGSSSDTTSSQTDSGSGYSQNSSSSGSGTGSQIASYGLQFVGYPYVAGGTSLTSGVDCSGFVQAVYKHFGYNLPRTSYSQSTVGRAVSYSEAQPGDIFYYGGHVGIYIGNGQIVHASTERTGIKVTAATYRSIVTIRRVVN